MGLHEQQARDEQQGRHQQQGLREPQGLHERYGLTRLINARGPFTPTGVSRSDEPVGRAVAEALGGFFVMEELHDLADRTLARATGAAAGTVVHCTSSAITLSVAAAMTGESAERIASLPDTGGLPARVVLPAGHAIDYGHPLVQDIRLAGGTPVLSGSDAACTLDELEKDLAHPGTACLVLVSSRLTRGARIPVAEAVAAAHRRGVPAIIDGAAQSFRVGELLGTGADLVLVSGQKYLGGPTAGLVLGRAGAVRAVRAQGKGIGRAMKASKEAIVGTLAALEARQELDVSVWKRQQEEKVARFVARAGALPGLTAHPVPDPTGLPFPRAALRVDAARAGLDAPALADALRAGDPQIWLYTDRQDDDELALELVPLSDEEVDVVLSRVTEIVGAGAGLIG
ncbi:aminotransferase class V-fold PLP-dependent enzyme [Streptomyces fractus]|uniref:aminotransferase class V-fold PLP-dependent enzyme n=1 Tax=Streptomyces fractus TaxID=641806 RepID=UPI003CF4C817